MILKTTNPEQTFIAHFHHSQTEKPGELWHRTTTVLLHHAPCANKGLPCNTPETWYGSAKCSRKDHFSKAKGRKLALARAMVTMPREIRVQLWQAYFKRFPIAMSARMTA